MVAQEMKEAVHMYNTLCSALDNRNWNYERDDDALKISFKVDGDDLTMSFLMVIDAERKLLRLMSWLPFNATKNPDVISQAVVFANYQMIAGSFDFDYKDGSIGYRLCASYKGAILSERACLYMIDVATNTVDEYNDELLMLERGNISLQQFMKKHE